MTKKIKSFSSENLGKNPILTIWEYNLGFVGNLSHLFKNGFP